VGEGEGEALGVDVGWEPGVGRALGVRPPPGEGLADGGAACPGGTPPVTARGEAFGGVAAAREPAWWDAPCCATGTAERVRLAAAALGAGR
jgi:hypothetical protein